MNRRSHCFSKRLLDTITLTSECDGRVEVVTCFNDGTKIKYPKRRVLHRSARCDLAGGNKPTEHKVTASRTPAPARGRNHSQPLARSRS